MSIFFLAFFVVSYFFDETIVLRVKVNYSVTRFWCIAKLEIACFLVSLLGCVLMKLQILSAVLIREFLKQVKVKFVKNGEFFWFGWFFA